MRISWLLVIMLVCTLILTSFGGCGKSPQTRIVVFPSGQPYETTRTDTIRLDNSDGTETIRQTERISPSTEQSLIFGNAIKVDASGGIDLHGVQLQVGSEVAKTYGFTYGQEKYQTKALEFIAGPGQDIQYEIEHYELWNSGIISFSVDGEKEEHAYEYRTEVGVRLLNSADLSLIGKYTLLSWEEAPSYSTVYMDVLSGSLEIDEVGNARWELAFQEKGNPATHQLWIICTGRVRVQEPPPQLAASWYIPENPDSDLRSESVLWEPAFAGILLPFVHEYPFQLTIKSLGEGKTILVMSNSEGTFTWEKYH